MPKASNVREEHPEGNNQLWYTQGQVFQQSHVLHGMVGLWMQDNQPTL